MATAEEIKQVRTLIPDTDAIYGAGEDEHLFSDEEISTFIAVAGGSILRAAGLAMIAVGNSEALIEKVIVTQDLETDGSKLQDKWRLSGLALLKQSQADDMFDGFHIINYREGWRRGGELVEPFDGTWPYGY